MTRKTTLCAYERYKKSSAMTLYDVYKQPSSAKLLAYDRCVECMNRQEGRNLRIISYNSQTFTCGFITNLYFVYITPWNIYHIAI